MSTIYTYLRGDLSIAPRLATGEPGALTSLGDTVDAELTVETEYIDNFNNNAAISSQDLHVAHKVTGKIKVITKAKTATVLGLALFGTAVTETGGAFTAEAFPAGLVVGGKYRLPNNRANLSSLTIKDSAGSPTTLTLGTHYTADLKNGTITILSLTGKTQPLTAEGTEVASQVSIPMLKNRSQEYYLMLEGIDVTDGDKAVLVDVYRVAFGPAAKVTLKGSGGEPEQYEFEGVMLADPQKAASATFGRYGRYRILE